jgi:hypothetical protein
VAGAEFDELKLQVTLVDNASAQLKTIKDTLDAIGTGSQTSNLAVLKRHTSELDESLRRMIETVSKGPKAFADLARNVSIAGISLGTFGLAVEKVMGAAEGLSKTLIELQHIAMRSGLDPAKIDQIARAYERHGMTQERGRQEAEAFAHQAEDLTRRTSAVRNQLYQELTRYPAALSQVDRLLYAPIDRAPEVIDKFNAMKKGAQDLFEYFKAQGNEPLGRRVREIVLGGLGAPGAINIPEAVAPVTDAMSAAMAKQLKAAEDYEGVTRKINQEWEEIHRLMVTDLMDSGLITVLKYIDSILVRWKSWIEERHAPATPGAPPVAKGSLGRPSSAGPQQNFAARSGSMFGSGEQQRGNELLQDQNTQTKALIEEMKRTNALLSGEEGPGAHGGVGGGGVAGIPGFRGLPGAGAGLPARPPGVGGRGGIPGFRGLPGRGAGLPGRPPGVGGGDLPGGERSSGVPRGREGATQAVIEEWRKAGMSDEGIAGVLANIKEESGFDPTLRHPDQPKFGGEAHFAHGLYQEGGDEWNHYEAWLAKNHPGADWRDPVLQSRFAAENLKTNYPKVWQKMLSGNREAAAEAYVGGYLKPAQQYQQSRIAKFQARGVPALSSYPTGQQGAEAAPAGGGGQTALPFRTAHNEEVERYVGFDRALANLDPEFRARLTAAYKDMPEDVKKSFLINEGWRSPEYQEHLFETRSGRGLVGAPGHSRHEIGQAADLDAGPARDWLREHGGQYGIEGIRGDEPHFQLSRSYRGHPFYDPRAERVAAAPAQGMELTGVRRRFDDLLSPQRVDGSGEIHVKVDQASFHRPRSVLQKVAMPVFAQGEKAAVGPPAPVAATGEGREVAMEE